ncbi:DUF742 domain-containing protein [Embleya sp. NPDC001921]
MTSGAGGGGHTRRGVVRSHTVIRARAAAAEGERPHIDVATLLSVDPTAPVTGLGVQARRVVALLVPGVLSVADVSAHLELPGAVARAVVADLVVSGHVRAADPFTPLAQPHDRDFLERVLHGLQRL